MNNLRQTAYFQASVKALLFEIWDRSWEGKEGEVESVSFPGAQLLDLIPAPPESLLNNIVGAAESIYRTFGDRNVPFILKGLSKHWQEQWGHDWVMQSLGHGVSWEDRSREWSGDPMIFKILTVRPTNAFQKLVDQEYFPYPGEDEVGDHPLYDGDYFIPDDEYPGEDIVEYIEFTNSETTTLPTRH